MFCKYFLTETNIFDALCIQNRQVFVKCVGCCIDNVATAAPVYIKFLILGQPLDCCGASVGGATVSGITLAACSLIFISLGLMIFLHPCSSNIFLTIKMSLKLGRSFVN